MNKRQYKRAVALIKKDCHLGGEYIDDKGRTCAIGCLALAAGVSKNTLKKNGCIVSRPSIWRPVKRAFGLDKWDQRSIQNTNDATNNFTPQQRRREILPILRGIFKASKTH